MDKDLEAKIEERKKQAEKRNIHRNAWMVAKYLGGRSYYRSECGSIEQTTYTFKNDNFLITDEYSESHGSDGSMGGGSTEVKYKDKMVYMDAGAGIFSYIPGTWEKKLNKLYSKAVEVMEQKEKEDKAKKEELAKKEEDKEKSKWGL